MSQTPQYNVEDGFHDLLTSISGLNVYRENRVGARLFPYATISTTVNEQMVVRSSGVYDISVDINYADTAAKRTADQFDEDYCAIFEALYSEAFPLKTKLQNTTLNTKIYSARIMSQKPTIQKNKKAWQRGLTISVYCTPDDASDGLRFLDFSNELNSQYIAVI